jgi:hypothetical protein
MNLQKNIDDELITIMVQFWIFQPRQLDENKQIIKRSKP